MGKAITTTAHIIAIIRDLVLIALVVAFIVGAAQYVADVRHPKEPARSVQSPPLPVDRCGGGIC